MPVKTPMSIRLVRIDFTPEEIKLIKEKRLQGVSFKVIAGHLGVSQQLLHKKCKDLGLTKSYLELAEYELIRDHADTINKIALDRDCLITKELISRLGVSRTVANRLYSYVLKLRRDHYYHARNAQQVQSQT